MIHRASAGIEAHSELTLPRALVWPPFTPRQLRPEESALAAARATVRTVAPQAASGPRRAPRQPCVSDVVTTVAPQAVSVRRSASGNR
jgi:hypothetical protein